MEGEYRKAIDTVADWIVAYRDGVERYPVLSGSQPGDILRQLPESPQPAPEAFAEIMRDFEQIILPGITHWQHPSFFGYFPANSSPPSVLAEMLVAALGVQGMSWATSPAATELEMRMMEWMRDFLGLPASFTGVIQDSASDSTMAAMIAARERITDYSVNEHGYRGPRLVAYCSSEAHSSIEKGAKIIGLGRENLRKIPVNDRLEMRTDLLLEAIVEDKRRGCIPFFVVGAFGTTGTTAVDDLSAIARIAKDQGLWFHVDAAYAGSALSLPELRPLAAGIEDADSLVMNPHKWLLTTFECSVFFLKHKDVLLRSFAICPEYLKTPDDGAVVNYRDWSLGLGRRFRSLKLWFVFRWYGTDGMRALLRGHIELARTLEEWIRADDSFELVAPRNFNLVCFRMRGTDAENEALLLRLNSSGRLFLTHTRVNGRLALRLVTGQTEVTERHVHAAWEEIRRQASALKAETKKPVPPKGGRAADPLSRV